MRPREKAKVICSRILNIRCLKEFALVAMAAAGMALHATAHLLPQRSAHCCQANPSRVSPVRWGCGPAGRDAHRIQHRDTFQLHATAALDMEAIESQVKGEFPLGGTYWCGIGHVSAERSIADKTLYLKIDCGRMSGRRLA